MPRTRKPSTATPTSEDMEYAATRRMPVPTSLNLEQLSVIRAAARELDVTVSQFIRSAAVTKACRVTGREVAA